MKCFITPRRSLFGVAAYDIVDSYGTIIGSIKTSIDRTNAQVLDNDKNRLAAIKVLQPSMFNKTRKLELCEQNQPARYIILEPDSRVYRIPELGWGIRWMKNTIQVIRADGSAITFNSEPFDTTNTVEVFCPEKQDLIAALALWAGFLLDMDKVYYEKTSRPAKSVPPKTPEPQVKKAAVKQPTPDPRPSQEAKIEEMEKLIEKQQGSTAMQFMEALTWTGKLQDTSSASTLRKLKEDSDNYYRKAVLALHQTPEKLQEFNTDRFTLSKAFLKRAESCSQQITELKDKLAADADTARSAIEVSDDLASIISDTESFIGGNH